MFTKTLLCVAQTSFLLLLFLFPPNHCYAKQTQKYRASCGEIQDISFPFVLREDRNTKCQDNKYILTCENNQTLLHLGSRYYHVKEIGYSNLTIRIVDTAINTNVCSALPIQPFQLPPHYLFWTIRRSTTMVLFFNCEKPVKSPLFLDITTYCDWEATNSSESRSYQYVMAGVERATMREIGDSCTGDTMVLTSSPLTQNRIDRDFSLEDVYSELAYGFDLPWLYGGIRCKDCRRWAACLGDPGVSCPKFCFNFRSFLEALLSAPVFAYTIVYTTGLIIAARVLCVPCVFAFLAYKFRRRHSSSYDSIEGFLRSQNNLMPIRYTYRDIKKMTNNFKDKLGEGGYGSVYKGKLRSGHFVAIKMLNKPKANGQEFINEVATIGRIHHVNVVKLIGYSAERSKRALVYDFMPNGSLDKYIFSEEESFPLICTQIYKISLGVARGIEYLHDGCDMQILHFDIKPHNILLDENFVPKVSDFGLAKLYSTEDSIVSLTAARGTMGYMAPELFYKNIGGVSYKADVYSFGMLLVEMAGRRRNWNSNADSDEVYFPSWVYDQLTNQKEIIIGEMIEDKEMMKKMMMVALWCVQMNPTDRPSMNKVVEMLEGDVEFLQMAPRPFFYPEAMPSAKNDGFYFSSSILGGCIDSTSLNVSGR